jgi:hypothetical protein
MIGKNAVHRAEVDCFGHPAFAAADSDAAGRVFDAIQWDSAQTMHGLDYDAGKSGSKRMPFPTAVKKYDNS